MDKIFLLLLISLSLLPILLYPTLVSLSIMIFDSPNAVSKISNHIAYLCVLLYPIFIFIMAWLAWKHQSFVVACIGLLPLIILIYAFSGSSYREEFKTKSRDYVCTHESFLHIVKAEGKDFGNIDVYEKTGFNKYVWSRIAYIRNKKEVHLEESQSMDLKMSPYEYVTTCKNAEGKTVADEFKIITNVNGVNGDKSI